MLPLYQELPIIYEHPKMQFSSVLDSINFRRRNINQITAPVNFLKEKYHEVGKKQTIEAETNWIMGELQKQAIGNIDLKELKNKILKS